MAEGQRPAPRQAQQRPRAAPHPPQGQRRHRPHCACARPRWRRHGPGAARLRRPLPFLGEAVRQRGRGRARAAPEGKYLPTAPHSTTLMPWHKYPCENKSFFKTLAPPEPLLYAPIYLPRLTSPTAGGGAGRNFSLPLRTKDDPDA